MEGKGGRGVIYFRSSFFADSLKNSILVVNMVIVGNIQSYLIIIFCHNFVVKNFEKICTKNLNWELGGQRMFGVFLKIHPILFGTGIPNVILHFY